VSLSVSISILTDSHNMFVRACVRACVQVCMGVNEPECAATSLLY